MAKKTKKGKTVLIVLLIIIVALAAIALWQKDNITALVESYTMTDDDLAKRSEEDKQKVNAYLEENELQSVRDMTQEEQEALIKEEITDGQAIQIMKEEITLEQAKEENKEAVKPVNPPKAENKDDKKPADKKPVKEETVNTADYDKQISDLVAQIYVLKARFTSSLSNLAVTVDNAFHSLPQSEWNNTNKNRIIAQYTQTALNMQAECDAQVESILKQLDAVLTKAGRSKELITTIRTSYENEKKATKAMYIKEYLN